MQRTGVSARGTGCKSPAERSTTQPYGKRAAPTSLRPGLEPCQQVYTCRRTPSAPTAQTCHRVLGSCRVGRERPSLPLAFPGPSPFRASSALGHRPTRSVLGSALGGKQPCAECQLLHFVVKISTPPDKQVAKGGQGSATCRRNGAAIAAGSRLPVPTHCLAPAPWGHRNHR